MSKLTKQLQERQQQQQQQQQMAGKLEKVEPIELNRTWLHSPPLDVWHSKVAQLDRRPFSQVDGPMRAGEPVSERQV